MKKQLIVYVLIFFVMGLPNLLIAQGIAEDPNDVLVPIDGGLAILLGAAAAYGSHKIQERRKRKG
jgi:hypothetical protein